MKKNLLLIVLLFGLSFNSNGQIITHDPSSMLANVLGFTKSLQEAIQTTGELKKNVETAKGTLDVIKKTQGYLNKASDYVQKLEEIKASAESLSMTIRFVQSLQKRISENREFFTLRQQREILDYYTHTLQTVTHNVKNISKIINEWENANDKDRKDAIEGENNKVKANFKELGSSNATVLAHINTQKRLQELARKGALTTFDMYQTMGGKAYCDDLPEYLKLRETAINMFSDLEIKYIDHGVASVKQNQKTVFKASTNEYLPQFKLYRRIFYTITALVFLIGIVRGYSALQRKDGSFAGVVMNFGLSLLIMLGSVQIVNFLFM